MTNETIYHLMRIYHFSTTFSIRLIQANELLYAMPKEFVDAALIAGDSSLRPMTVLSEESVQYINTPALETYLCFVLEKPNRVLIVGPLLKEPVSAEKVSFLIRRSLLPFHAKETLSAHYAACPVLDEQRLFYAGQLLEELFSNHEISGDSISQDSVFEELTLQEATVNRLFTMQKYDYRMQQFSHPPYAIEQEVCRAISKGDTSLSKRILAEINRLPRAKLASTMLRSIKNSLIGSATFMARAAISGGVSPDEAFSLSDAYIQWIEQCTELSVLTDFEIQMIEGFAARVRAVRSGQYSPTVLDAMRFVETHLSEQLSIQDIADAVHHNPNYLSGLFHRETGETMRLYIIRMRIEESLYFVRHTDISFSEIASFYQFCSQSHYTQNFRRIMGITPGEARKRQHA